MPSFHCRCRRSCLRSLILSTAHGWTSVILAGKRGSRRHSTTSFVARMSQWWKQVIKSWTSIIILRSGEGLTSFNKHNHAYFSGETKSTIKLSCRGVHFFYPGYQRFFSRAAREFSVLPEGRHIFDRRPKPRVTIKTWKKPETALEKSLAPRVPFFRRGEKTLR